METLVSFERSKSSTNQRYTLGINIIPLTLNGCSAWLFKGISVFNPGRAVMVAVLVIQYCEGKGLI